eukprot:Tamp_07115.p1 GENE.Tamp_07115~~Tamp_07115.p1  ORF type:complete len:473 (-),score=128.53 Tamp_07115:1147-2484(-)
MAESKADLARECSAADENTPPPPLAALGLKFNRVHKHPDHAAHTPAAGGEGGGDSGQSASLAQQKLELAKSLEDAQLQHLSKELSESRGLVKQLRELVLAQEAAVREAELARANATKELLRVRTQSEALIEAQEEHLIEVRKQYALEHERRLEEAAARSERELLMLEREIQYLKNRKEPSATSQLDKGKETDGKKDANKLGFTVVPLGGAILSETERTLEDACLLAGPRKMAIFGGLLTWGIHAYVIKVEALKGVIDGYIGVASERNPSQAIGFSLLCDDNTLGQGAFGAMDPVDGTRRIEDGKTVVLQIDVDGEMLSLLTLEAKPKVLASCAITLQKPYTPAAMIMAAQSSVRLVSKKLDSKAQKSSQVAERVVFGKWKVRSLNTGIEYNTAQVLELVQQVELKDVSLTDLQHLNSLFKNGQERVHDTIMARLSGTQVQLQHTA